MIAACHARPRRTAHPLDTVRDAHGLARTVVFVAAAVLVFTSCSPDVIDPDFDNSVPGALVVQAIDPFGAPVRDARIEATGLSGGQSNATATTDVNGLAEFPSIPAGAWLVTGSRQGFESASTNVTVNSGSTATAQLTLDAATLPTAAVVAARVVSWSSSQLEFETDLAVTDGSRVLQTSPSALSINSFNGLDFSQISAASVNGGGSGPFSAVMLFDQSGSIQTTDPGDSRLQAAKFFLSAMGAGDEVVVSAFSSGGRLQFEPVTVWGSFTANGRSYFSLIDQLASLEGGGTPLYAATSTMTSYVAANGSRPNRAVLVFTDGRNTDAGSMDDAINLARSRNVKLFMIGLSQDVDVAVLSEMAERTGGALMWAGDARQLVSYYRTLGAILRGEAVLQRVRWRVTRSTGSFGRGSYFYTSVRVGTSAGTIAAPFRVTVP